MESKGVVDVGCMGRMESSTSDFDWAKIIQIWSKSKGRSQSLDWWCLLEARGGVVVAALREARGGLIFCLVWYTGLFEWA